MQVAAGVEDVLDPAVSKQDVREMIEPHIPLHSGRCSLRSEHLIGVRTDGEKFPRQQRIAHQQRQHADFEITEKIVEPNDPPFPEMNRTETIVPGLLDNSRGGALYSDDLILAGPE